jgi:DNA (cytosine-5)-methyltransferase 1
VTKRELRENFKFIDLFAGIGGMRLGFERAGGVCVFSSEWDKYAAHTYEANFGERPHGDITKIRSDIIPEFDVLVAGFPCQPFSAIGRREGFAHPTQGTLFHDIVRVMRYHENQAFLLENVPALIGHDNGRTLKVIEEALTRLKYRYDYKVLNSADFGVPQIRQRIYIAGYRSSKGGREALDWPRGTKRHHAIGPLLQTDVTGYEISKGLQERYLFKTDDGKPEIVDEATDHPVRTLVASYHKIQRRTGTFVRGGETGLRLLTEQECKAIMGFPLSYKIPVSRTQMYRQFGNSVTVPVIREIASWMANGFRSTHRE